jgi:elongation factor Ts
VTEGKVPVPMELVKRLRDMTMAGMMDCKRALEDAGGDLERAATLLRERGIAKAAARAGRATSNGVVEAYLHRTSADYPPQVGAMIELDCETDFVAKSEEFRRLARELAMHVAAANPRWIRADEIPVEVVEAERDLYRRQAEEEGRPASAIPKIVEGRLRQFRQGTVLLEQPFVRDGHTTVQDLIAQAMATLQENIAVRRFSRFAVKEG